MSLFKTDIPVDVAKTLAQLPPGSFLVSAKLNEPKTAVEIVWGCDALKTAYTFPTDYSMEKLHAPPAVEPAAKPKRPHK